MGTYLSYKDEEQNTFVSEIDQVISSANSQNFV